MKVWRAITIVSALAAAGAAHAGAASAAEGIPPPGSPAADICRAGFGAAA